MEKHIKSNESGLGYITEILNLLKNDWLDTFSQEKKFQIIYRGITKIYPGDLIRSGASIRLDQSAQNGKHYSYSDYIVYHQNLIQKAKDNYPDSYKDWTDLEILADLQHNGAATCLVDFSKNVLISLWFACNDGNEKDELKKVKTSELILSEDAFQKSENSTLKTIDDSYAVLYCYNVTYDLVYDNKLTQITNKSINRNIADILLQTKKITNFCSNTDYSFLLWEPAILNNRIARQDSIFLFGMNKFEVSRHHIFKIYIHKSIKWAILDALNRFFNISATTIFCDKQGFATTNDKMKKKSDFGSDKNLYIKAFSEMFAGDYKTALQYFEDEENTNNDPLISFPIPNEIPTDFYGIKDEDNLIKKYISVGELFLSKAICYKDMQDDIYCSYDDNAIFEYEKAKLLFYEVRKSILSVLNKPLEKGQKESYCRKYNRYCRKTLRIYNDIMNIMYTNEDYVACVKYCKEAIQDIDNIKKQKIKMDENYSSIYCKIAVMELLVLQLIKIKGTNDKDEKSALNKEWEEIRHSLPKEEEITDCTNNEDSKENLTNFDKSLIKFFDLIYSYLSNEDKREKLENVDKKYRVNQMTEIFVKSLNNTLKTDEDCRRIDYSTWDFSDLIKVIKSEDVFLEREDKKYLLNLIAYMIDARDLYKRKYLDNSSEY